MEGRIDRLGLHYETVTPLLRTVLAKLMSEPLFSPFRLVGGTNLSLKYGHRRSDDIDLFTDAEYASLDFSVIEACLSNSFAYFDPVDKFSDIVGFGRTYFIGESKDKAVKLDLMYTDPFVYPMDVRDGIRMAHSNDIFAMKMVAISGEARKKDFWDMHLALSFYSLSDVLEMYRKRSPWEYDEKRILEKMVDFSSADKWPDPMCLMQKDWDFIKMDIIDIVREYSEKI